MGVVLALDITEGYVENPANPAVHISVSGVTLAMLADPSAAAATNATVNALYITTAGTNEDRMNERDWLTSVLLGKDGVFPLLCNLAGVKPTEQTMTFVSGVRTNPVTLKVIDETTVTVSGLAPIVIDTTE